jgi:predicted SAM-dependent methyltransferase
MPLFGREREKENVAVPLRLHLGCGQAPIPGWINIDVQQLPGVDRVLDVRRGLPFESVAAIYGEHFLEHLELVEGLACLVECRRVLAPDGILRISTPNLDWVVASHYRYGCWGAEAEAVSDCFSMNRAFHGWGHRFLYNRQALAAAFRAAGFSTITMHRYGESDVPELTGLERHEKWDDTAELPHVLVAQASGSRERLPMPRKLLVEYKQALESK